MEKKKKLLLVVFISAIILTSAYTVWWLSLDSEDNDIVNFEKDYEFYLTVGDVQNRTGWWNLISFNNTNYDNNSIYLDIKSTYEHNWILQYSNSSLDLRMFFNGNETRFNLKTLLPKNYIGVWSIWIENFVGGDDIFIGLYKLVPA